jgi:DNA polymerase III epsilon subunit-like protein
MVPATPTLQEPVNGAPPEAVTAPEVSPPWSEVKAALARGDDHEGSIFDGIPPLTDADRAEVAKAVADGKIIDDVVTEKREKTAFDPIYTVFDTETSGLLLKGPDGKFLPAEAEGQPRLCQLTMLHVNLNLDIVKKESFYVKPDGWKIDPGAFQAHGLTIEFLEKRGVPVRQVLDAYTAAIKDGRTLIAHNAQYDMKVMRGELRRAGMEDLFEDSPNACTMRSLTGVCKIPNRNGRAGYKWPTLEEACTHFNIPYSNGHDAEGDAMKCYLLFCKAMKLVVLQTPRVHYAKDRPTEV